MKKNIKKTVIIFSIAIIGIFNFTSLSNNVSFSDLNLNKLLSQAVAVCENPGGSYVSRNNPTVYGSESFLEYSRYSSYTSNGCNCTETFTYTSCQAAYWWDSCTSGTYSGYGCY